MKINDNTTFIALKNPSFRGLLFTQSLGAFNDNFFRTAIATLITFCLANISGEQSSIYVNLGIGLFMLPFFLFSALAGELSDKINRTTIIKWTKFFEIVIACLASYFFVTQSIPGLMLTLFLMGLQSTFFGPVKLSILPCLLNPKELISGNAIGLSGTYFAILCGVIVGSLTFIVSSTICLPIIMITVAMLGFLTSFLISNVEPADPKSIIHLNILKSTIQAISYVKYSTQIFLTILGASWGWLMASVIVGQLPGITSSLINANNLLFLVFVGVLTIGIISGAAIISKLCKGNVTSYFIPIVSICLTIALTDFAFATGKLSFNQEQISISKFFDNFSAWHFTISLLTVSIFLGMYIVPLETLLQKIAPNTIRSRIIGGENIVCSLFIVLGAVLSITVVKLFDLNYAYPILFAILTLINALFSLAICYLLPTNVIRIISSRILRFCFRVKVEGLENLASQENKKTLIIANHTGLLDGILIWTFIDSDIYFAIDKKMSEKWLVKIFLSFANYFSVDSSNPMAIKDMIKIVNEGKKVLIFPEGRITTTGGLMKVYPGPSMIARKTGADVIPICFEGSQYRFGSYFGSKLKHRPNNRIVIKVLPAEKPCFEKYGNDQNIKSDTVAIYDLLASTKVKASDLPNETMFRSFLTTVNNLGKSRIILEDIQRNPLTLGKLTLASFIFGRWFKKHEQNEKIGFLLPNSSASVITFLGLQACGKIPCMLNFSAGIANILSCIDSVQISSVVTSKTFIEQGKLQHIEQAIKDHKINMIYLEDIKENISFLDKLYGFCAMKHKVRSYEKLCDKKTNSDLPAVILFTSGSEGTPKGVVLSHRNIQTNIVQLQSVLSFGLLDIVFNAMPMFHSFGLTAGTLLPLLCGVRFFMYPSPLHYKKVPLLVYDTNATALFGTDTFLKGYAKYAHPYDMYEVRFAVAGGEKLKEDTVKIWQEKFGIRIFEGYGATETSPVIAVNTNMFYRNNTVGRILPCIETKIEPIPGIDRGGRLFVRGDNVMLGYIKADKPGVIQELDDHWYDTGDIVEIDELGFAHILGRAKRFAKIAGEMISLTAVEMALNQLYENVPLAIISTPDEKRGEALILYIQKENVNKKEIQNWFRQKGLSDLSVPSYIKYLEEIPLNGTGKIDYVKITEIAKIEFD